MAVTMVSISRLVGSSRNPMETVTRPETSQSAAALTGTVMCQCRTSRRSAQRRDTVMAAMDRRAHRRGRPRSSTMIRTKAAKGRPAASRAAAAVMESGVAAVMGAPLKTAL